MVRQSFKAVTVAKQSAIAWVNRPLEMSCKGTVHQSRPYYSVRALEICQPSGRVLLCTVTCQYIHGIRQLDQLQTILFWVGCYIFCFILLTHKGSHGEVYREFQPSYDIFRRSGVKGCLDHSGFCAPAAYTAIANSVSTKSKQPVKRTAYQI